MPGRRTKRMIVQPSKSCEGEIMADQDHPNMEQCPGCRYAIETGRVICLDCGRVTRPEWLWDLSKSYMIARYKRDHAKAYIEQLERENKNLRLNPKMERTCPDCYGEGFGPNNAHTVTYCHRCGGTGKITIIEISGGIDHA